jgi:hypothetical protein
VQTTGGSPTPAPVSTTPLTTTPPTTTAPSGGSPTPSAGVLTSLDAAAPLVFRGPTGCVAHSFHVYVAGATLRGVSFYVRGYRLGRLTSQDGRGRYTMRVEWRLLAPGATYRVLAQVGELPHGLLLLRRVVHICA